MPFFILFVLIPLAEIIVFIKVSGHIGLGTALLMALFTAVLGGFLVKLQGLATLAAVKTAMVEARIPSRELFDGFCIVAAGATLITPGFITDIIGFALLFPPTRDLLFSKVTERFKHINVHGQYHYEHQSPNQDPDIIDVEFKTIDKDEEQS